MIDVSLYQYELKEIIKDLIRTEFPKAISTGKGYRFKCPLCVDSDHKARGNFMLDNSSYGFKYKCFNSGCRAEDGIDTLKFLKANFPEYYQRFWNEVFKMQREDDEAKKKRADRQKKNRYLIERKVPKKVEDSGKIEIANVKEFNKNNLKDLKDIISIELHQPAIEWCKSRMIPESVYMKWFYIPENCGKYSNRIIIPFRNDKGQIYYFQGRTLGDSIPKYKNSIGTKGVYNYYEVDISKPVMIVEGPIDSHFLENCIAIMGTSVDEEIMNTIKQKYYIFDNDASGRSAAYKRLEAGEYVFMWKQFIKNFAFVGEKVDINIMAIKLNKEMFTFKELSKFFTNNVLFKAFV